LSPQIANGAEPRILIDQALEKRYTSRMTSANTFTPAAEATIRDVIARWSQLVEQAAGVLDRGSLDAIRIAEFQAAARRVIELSRDCPDAALFVLIQMAAGELVHYSARHALLCALVAELCARRLEWAEPEIESLVCAALTMNIAMTHLQNTLARQLSPLTAEQRQAVNGHAARSAELLKAAGVIDPLWLEVVLRHHEADPLLQVQPPLAQRMAHLLRRVDLYTAKLSRRAGRHPRSPAIAARDACLNSAGLPDAVGATLLNVLGLYPPGCYVALANGDTAVVIARGAHAHGPVAAALRRADGTDYESPVRRDTLLQEFEVLRSLPLVTSRLQHGLAAILGALP